MPPIAAKLIVPLVTGIAVCAVGPSAGAQPASPWSTEGLAGLAHTRAYASRRASSADPTGANQDMRRIAPGEKLGLMDEVGSGVITHIWFTVASPDPLHLKKLILRMYWDDEVGPSVESPLGDFFGLGLGEYVAYESAPLVVGADRSLNCFFPMPFHRRARIVVENQGEQPVPAFYYNIDFQSLSVAPTDALQFHAQYRQAVPIRGWTDDWSGNDDPRVRAKPNPDGKDNYVWLEAIGRGHFVGVAQSIVQTHDGWWGEGDDMLFVDGESLPSIRGTGSEDYFLGAWGFDGGPFAHALFGAPVKGEERAGSRSSVYRFHLESPITFSKSLRATIEHGHANHRSDDFYSVAYWYQVEPHAPFPALPSVAQRLPPVSGAEPPSRSRLSIVAGLCLAMLLLGALVFASYRMGRRRAS